MTSISDRQIKALRALEQFSMGKTTAFLNWADADTLVELGFAKSYGTGRYVITQEGMNALQQFRSSEKNEGTDGE